MSAIKEKMIELIKALPEDVTVHDALDELCFKLQVQEGLDELDDDLWILHEAVEKRLAKWLM